MKASSLRPGVLWSAYGIRAFLIAQSLNQISKAYGENNAILDNCHVRICFSTNDERTAKRVLARPAFKRATGG
jgi:type IV secretory pathway TraG/TraD family ATPase VirD4